MSTTPMRYPITLSPIMPAVPMLCDSANVLEGAALVMGAADNSVALPSASEVGGFMGLALFDGSTSVNGSIYVITSGFYPAVASGTITRGDLLCIAGTTGTVKTTVSGAEVIGRAVESATNGQRVNMRIMPGVASSAATSLVKAFVAGTGGVTANRIVVQDTTTNGQVVLPAAADPASGVIGVALNTALAAATAYVTVMGPASVVASGAVTRGDLLAVAATTGTAKTAAPSAGVNTMIVGYALSSISTTATGNAFVNPSVLQGAT